MAFLGKLLSKDTLSELADVITNLELLAEAETQIAEFYRLCSGKMEEEKDLWNFLADEELQHAETVRKMIALINKDPKLYKPGISFSTVIIRLFAVEMQRLVEQMNAGKITPGELFAIALQIEESAVELSYGAIVKTKDSVFNMLANRIDRESAGHKSKIHSKMNENL